MAEAGLIFVLVLTANLQLEWKEDKWTSVHQGCQVRAVGVWEGRRLGEGEMAPRGCAQTPSWALRPQSK